MDINEIRARQAVQDTIATYAHSGDRMRLDDLAACFTDDGILEVEGRWKVMGRAAIVARLTPDREATLPPNAPPPFRHFVTNTRFDSVTPNRIEASSYFVVFTGAGPDHWGRYRDVLVPSNDRWLFASRYARVDVARPDGWFAAS
ncbi:nuclear transport factor 2 family protein [Rhodococcus koreensis]